MTVARSIGRTSRPVAPAEEIGRSSPLGATVVEGGVNFSLFSRTVAGVELVLFDREDDAGPSRVIRIDLLYAVGQPETNPSTPGESTSPGRR